MNVKELIYKYDVEARSLRNRARALRNEGRFEDAHTYERTADVLEDVVLDLAESLLVEDPLPYAPQPRDIGPFTRATGSSEGYT